MGAKTVRGARHAGEALERLDGDRFDLLVTDIDLPELDGVALTRRIRAGLAGPRRDLPVLLTVALPTIGRIREARDAGVDEILLKPVSIRGLEKKIELAALHTRPFIETARYTGPDRRRPGRPYRGPLRRAGDRRGGDIEV